MNIKLPLVYSIKSVLGITDMITCHAIGIPRNRHSTNESRNESWSKASEIKPHKVGTTKTIDNTTNIMMTTI